MKPKIITPKEEVQLKIAVQCEMLEHFSHLLKNVIRTDDNSKYDHTANMRILIAFLALRLVNISLLEDEYNR